MMNWIVITSSIIKVMMMVNCLNGTLDSVIIVLRSDGLSVSVVKSKIHMSH